MEPVDPRMGGLLDGGGAGGPDELRSIVARAGRRRLRLAGIVGAAALAAGGGIGYGISSATSDGSTQQIVATSPQSGSPGGNGAYTAPKGASPSGAGSSAAVLEPTQFKSLFSRHVGTIDIRGFLLSLGTPLPYEGAATCGVAVDRFQAEISTPKMVGFAPAFLYQDTTGAIMYTQPSVVGVQEGDPVAVVDAYTSGDVAQVRMDFTGGSSDQMAPVQGWSSLAAPFTASTSTPDLNYGTLTAFDHAGHVLAKAQVQVAPKSVPGASGAGSGSAGSGSISSGSVHAAGGGTASSGVASSGSGSTGPAVSASPATATSPPATVTSPPASVVPAAVFPCNVPPQPGPTPLPCPPLRNSSGAIYACPARPPANTTTTAPRSGSGG